MLATQLCKITAGLRILRMFYPMNEPLEQTGSKHRAMNNPITAASSTAHSTERIRHQCSRYSFQMDSLRVSMSCFLFADVDQCSP